MMRCDVLAIGTELLLGQIVDTNSSWIGEQLAMVGIDTMEHRKVGDNLGRMITALDEMLAQADAVVVCGGLGPTQDDVTREAIAGSDGRRARDARGSGRGDPGDVRLAVPGHAAEQPAPGAGARGAAAIPNPIGTAPGIRAELDGKVIYAVPGVPYEMQKMVTEQVLPDLLERSGESAVIVSRSLKTWGQSESGLAEMIADRVDAQTNPTIAFLARGIEGLVVRLTAKAESEAEAAALIEAEEAELRQILGPLVFGIDDETIEHAALAALEGHGWTLGVGESLTAGLIGSRIGAVPGASRTFRGSIVSYATEVKRSVLGVTADQAVSEEAAREMALGAQRVLGADVGISATGVAGPDEQDGQPVGTVWFGIALPGREPETFTARLPGDRERVRQFAAISLLNALRQRLAALD